MTLMLITVVVFMVNLIRAIVSHVNEALVASPLYGKYQLAKICNDFVQMSLIQKEVTKDKKQSIIMKAFISACIRTCIFYMFWNWMLG